MMLPIKNFMETVVKTEVARQKMDAKAHSSCWCSLCEADVIALSLTRLPPRYCLARSYGLLEQKSIAENVHTSVGKAMAKVHARPKHRPGVPTYFPHRVRVLNFALEEGASLVGQIMRSSSSPCTCNQCMADTLAFALNRFPPLYGIEFDGNTNFPPTRRDFFRHDLSMVLEQASRAVALHPHH